MFAGHPSHHISMTMVTMGTMVTMVTRHGVQQKNINLSRLVQCLPLVKACGFGISRYSSPLVPWSSGPVVL